MQLADPEYGTRRQALLEPLPSGEDLMNAVSGTCSSGNLSVVFFSSRQCAACRAFLPKLRKLAATLSTETTRFFYLEHSALTKEAFKYHEVTEVPTFMLFDGEGDLVASKSGLSPSDWGEVRTMIERCAERCATEAAWGM
jgi:thiol-disulfide isomerase/thioredoxin